MRLTVEPDLVALAPGDVVDLLVRIHNDGEELCTPVLQVRGLDPVDVLVPTDVVAVAPGGVLTSVVRVRAAEDSTPGDQRIGVAVEDLEGLQRPVTATTVLRVGARPDVAVEVDPVATAGRRGAAARTILRNRSDRRLQVVLEATGEGVSVQFRPSVVTLDPGETKRVRTRMRRARRSWFSEIRHGAVITARGIGAPASTTATFTQRPGIPPLAVRGTAALLALTVWIAATVVVFQRINADPPAPEDTGVATGPAVPGPGRTSAIGLFDDDAEEAGVRLPVVIQGTVEGPRNPSGTTVTVERLSFGDEGTTAGITKISALTQVKLPRGSVLDLIRTDTDERGRFRVASGLVPDAFYRVTAVRAGFEIGSFIVSTSADAPEVTLAVALTPASGALAGRVIDAAGAPIAGAQVVVTDGTATYTTATGSEGDEAGRWSLEGLATPATYQVIVARLGFATQTLLVELDGGQVRSDVNASLPPNLGTIIGRVTAVNPDTRRVEGVGALDVTLAGPEARLTKTLTVEGSTGELRGRFDFPALPYGDYIVTFSGDGWVTRQAEIAVRSGQVSLDVADMTRSTGIVQGYVWQVATSECRYPKVEQRDGDGAETAGTRERPCGGVSVSVVDDSGDVYATASANGSGFFQIGGVPAGQYTLTLARPGYVSHIRAIRVHPGGVTDLNPVRTADTARDVTLTNAVAGEDYVPLGLTAPPAACVGTVIVNLQELRGGALRLLATDASGTEAITVRDADCEPGNEPRAVRIGTSSSYRLENVPLGVKTLDVLAPGYAARSVADLIVNAVDVQSVTVTTTALPRDLVIPGERFTLVGPPAVQRSLTVELRDATGTVLASSADPLVLNGGEVGTGTITVPALQPAEGLRLFVVGDTFVLASSAPFTHQPGVGGYVPPLEDIPAIEVQARARISGRTVALAETTAGGALEVVGVTGATVTVPSDVGAIAVSGLSAVGTPTAGGWHCLSWSLRLTRMSRNQHPTDMRA
jgi:hypothetical protein